MCSNCPEHIWIMSLHPSVMWCRTATLYFAFLLWWRYFMTVSNLNKNFPESKAFLDHLYRRKVAQTNPLLGNWGWGNSGLHGTEKPWATLEVSDHCIWSLKLPHSASCPPSCTRVNPRAIFFSLYSVFLFPIPAEFAFQYVSGRFQSIQIYLYGEIVTKYWKSWKFKEELHGNLEI